MTEIIRQQTFCNANVSWPSEAHIKYLKVIMKFQIKHFKSFNMVNVGAIKVLET